MARHFWWPIGKNASALAVKLMAGSRSSKVKKRNRVSVDTL